MDKQRFHPSESPMQQFPTIPGTFSPTSTFNDIYSTLWPQNPVDRAENKTSELPYMFPDHSTYKSTDLADQNKDLSPNSFYSITDPALINSMENQYCRFENSQWPGSCGVKPAGSYQSCAQMGKFYGDSRTTYCSVPKGSTEFRSCDYYTHNLGYPSNQQLDNIQNCFGNYSSYSSSKYPSMPSEALCLSQSTPIFDTVLPEKMVSKEAFDLNYFSNLDSQAEASNDESDIVVEDSSSSPECSESEFSQTTLKPFHSTKCLVCNSLHSAGLQFYILTADNPMTMSTHIPVKKKLCQFTSDDRLSAADDYLCNDCLGLINSIDHLQVKLENLIKSLKDKMNLKTPPRSVKKPAKIKFKKYKCRKCCMVLSVGDYLENHLRRRHKTKRFLCELCGKSMLTFKKLKNHLKKHQELTVTIIPAYKCSGQHCRKAFRTKFHLKEHENYCLGLLPFKCKHCSKKFASATKLKSHIKLKHDKKFVAICSICNIGFVKTSDYKSHMTSHGTEKKFPCTKCDKAYKTLSNLNFHLKSHERVMPFVCSMCQKGFMRKEYYEAHMNNHKGVKNYSCAACDKKFVSQKNLDAHAKYHEGTVKSNKCNICKKVVVSSFEEHLRVHLNLREFECEVCTMKFNTKNSLSKHKKKKHVKNDEVS